MQMKSNLLQRRDTRFHVLVRFPHASAKNGTADTIAVATVVIAIAMIVLVHVVVV